MFHSRAIDNQNVGARQPPHIFRGHLVIVQTTGLRFGEIHNLDTFHTFVTLIVAMYIG